MRRRPQPRFARLRDRFWDWLTAGSIRWIAIAIASLLTFGTLGYMLIGGLSVVQGLYMAVITVTTVGFSDLAETAGGDAARLFTVVYIFLGVGVFSLTLSRLAAMVIEGRLRETLGRLRMERQINELEDHLVLCGYGRFGQITASEIVSHGVPLVVIDSDEAAVSQAEQHGLLGLVMDATEEDALERAGIGRARALLLTLPTDAENVYVILNARELRSEMPIVALARDRRAERKLRVAGATDVVSPYEIGASHMARQILTPHVARVVSLATGSPESRAQIGVEMREFLIAKGSKLAGVALRDSPIRREFGVIVVAIIDGKGESEFNPGPDVVVHAGDVLVSVGPEGGLEKLARASYGSAV